MNARGYWKGIRFKKPPACRPTLRATQFAAVNLLEFYDMSTILSKIPLNARSRRFVQFSPNRRQLALNSIDRGPMVAFWDSILI